MASRKTVNVARELWLSGVSESDIAGQLDLDRSTVEAWRDDEDWRGLRDTLADLAARRTLEQLSEADRTDAVLARNLRVNLARRLQEGNLTDLQLVRMTAALAGLRRTQDSIDRSIRDHGFRLETLEDHAA